MKDCVTHHYACDCREAAMQAEIARLRGLERHLQRAQELRHLTYEAHYVDGTLETGLAIPAVTERDEARAEVKRLRTAAQALVDEMNKSHGHLFGSVADNLPLGARHAFYDLDYELGDEASRDED